MTREEMERLCDVQSTALYVRAMCGPEEEAEVRELAAALRETWEKYEQYGKALASYSQALGERGNVEHTHTASALDVHRIADERDRWKAKYDRLREACSEILRTSELREGMQPELVDALLNCWRTGQVQGRLRAALASDETAK